MQNSYQSRDFYASAFLVAAGIPMESHFRTGNITTFVFADSENTQDLVTQYYGLQAVINPATYANAIRNLKSILHGSYTNTNQENKNERNKRC